MSVDAHNKETLGFQAEVQQLLRLVAHSLYSNKEVFLRELISNASDAGDKLRFEALTESGLYEDDPDLKIRIHFDQESHTLTVSDNGIGMNRQEVIDNIGTIARSGTRQFMERLSGDQAKDAHLIGQFGVGFYSSFIVADKVVLKTRRAGLSADQGVCWTSDGEGEYTLETIEKPTRGTEVVLHLREEERDLLSEWRLRSIITKYSDHITFPVIMPVQKFSDKEEDKDAPPTFEDERINQAAALWARPKSAITEDEYKTFYKHVGHDFEEPLAWTHSKVEGKLEYTSLLFIPNRAPFDLWDREQRHGVKLFVQRVFIMDDAEHLMPRYLRFVRGVIDSNDLPLNVSRELLQNSKIVDNIRSGSVKKVLSLLEDLAQNQPEKYAKFWKEFGRALKEGPAEDYANRETIAKLLRLSSTHTDSAEPTVTLQDYLGRMKEGQDKIYYIVADSFSAAKNSPHLEIFRKKGVEVLLLSDRVDEWLMSHLHDFEGKSLQSVAKGVLELDKIASEDEKEAQTQAQEVHKDLLARVQTTLGEKVKEVRLSSRLTASPACLVVEEHALSVHLERLLRDAGQETPMQKPSLEINPEHAFLGHLKAESDTERFTDWAHLLFEQALLAEGGQLEDPTVFVQRLNRLLFSRP